LYTSFIFCICSIDTSFGTTGAGYTYTNFAQADVSTFQIAELPNGNIVISGSATSVANTDYLIAQFNSSGVLDTTFGTTSGFTKIDLGNYDQATALQVLSTGKFILAGTRASSGDIYSYRLHANGTIDTTYGTAAGHTVVVLTGNDRIYDSYKLADDSVFLIGSQNGTTQIAVTKLTSAGILDTTFAGGTLLLNYGGFNNGIGYGMAEYGGYYYIGGQVWGTSVQFAVAKVDSTGVLDTTYGAGGYGMVDFSVGLDPAYNIIAQSDGKMVLCGKSQTGGVDFGLARFQTDGNLDTTFGAAGKTTFNLAGTQDQCDQLILQPDGKIIAIGEGSNQTNIVLVRYTSNGQIDTTFGTAGIFNTNFASIPTANLGASGVRAIQKSDGSIIVLARATVGGLAQVFLTKIK
jgi:uncharacterized delta-60 repeat protein